MSPVGVHWSATATSTPPGILRFRVLDEWHSQCEVSGSTEITYVQFSETLLIAIDLLQSSAFGRLSNEIILQ